jgi:plastocyanin
VKRIIPIFVTLGLLFAVAACGSSVTSKDPNAIETLASSFSKSSVTITQGQTLTFVDNSDIHYLTTGEGGLYEKEPGAADMGGPTGHAIDAGQVWTTPPWTTPGTYHITCTIHPAMNLTVMVTG